MKSIRVPKVVRSLTVIAIFASAGSLFASGDLADVDPDRPVVSVDIEAEVEVSVDIEAEAKIAGQELASDPEGFRRRLTQMTDFFSSDDFSKDPGNNDGDIEANQSLVQRVKRAAEHSGSTGTSLRVTGLAGFCCLVSAGFLYRKDYDAFLNAVRELLKDGATPENLAKLQHLVDSADRTPLNLLIAGTVLGALGALGI